MLYPKGVAKSLARRLPFVGGLTSLPFMAKIALLARLGVAGARIIMDAPPLNKNPRYTPQEKLTSFYERIFIEGGGTAVYHVGMFLGMDVAARLWERYRLQDKFSKTVHKLSNVGHKVGLKEVDAKTLGSDLEAVFRSFYQTRPKGGDKPTNGLMHLNLYAEDLYGSRGPRSHNGFMDAIHGRLQQNGLAKHQFTAVMQEIKKAMTPMSRSLLNGNFLVQTVGVALGCVLGGVVIQKLNDNVVRPFAMKLAGHKHNKVHDPLDGALIKAPPPKPLPKTPYPVGGVALPIHTAPLTTGRFMGATPFSAPTSAPPSVAISALTPALPPLYNPLGGM